MRRVDIDWVGCFVMVALGAFIGVSLGFFI